MGPASVRAAAQVFVADLSALEVSSDDAHHLTHVLRLKAGEKVVASDGAGGWCECRFVAGATSDSATLLEPEAQVVLEPEPDPVVTVGFVPVKGERPELVVQKLTEIGVDRIAIVRASRAVVRWEGERSDKALARLRRVAREAAAQSRRAWLPEIAGAMTLRDLGALVAPGKVALAEPGAGTAKGGITTIAVGPEGGWDETELTDSQERVGLSPFILRAETAAIAAGLMLCNLRAGRHFSS